MKLKFILSSISRNEVIAAVTVLFIAVAVMLASLVAGLVISLTGSTDRLMEDAKAFHFMQIHSGDSSIDGLETLAAQNDNVDDLQVLKPLNLDGSNIILGKHIPTGSLQGNGLCTQSSQFNLFLDLDQRPAKPAKGELYAPICYLKDGTARAGNTAMVRGISFTVAGSIRDPQMNSALAFSKRFLVNEDDYCQLASSGTVEYLIEFRLHDLSKFDAFEVEYHDVELPANNPDLIWPLFRMVNAVSDGILTTATPPISLLVIIVALLCIRFTLQAKIEDDYREIGVMKAIDTRVTDVRSLYLAIYAAIAMTSGALGFLLSLSVRKQIQVQIWLNFGDSENPAFPTLVDIAAAALIVLLVLLYVTAQLRRFWTISPVQAIRFGMGQRNGGSIGISSLVKNRRLLLSPLLAIRDVLSRKKLYSIMLAVIISAGFIMVVSQNLYHTMSDPESITYMRIGTYDLRLDLQQVEQLDGKTTVVENRLEQDRDISLYARFTTKTSSAKLNDRGEEVLKTGLGDHTVYPFQHTEGHMPDTDQDVASSVLSAEDLEKMTGDTMTIITDHGEQTFTVCGVYSDITNGGRTAKASFDDIATLATRIIICATLTDQGILGGKITSYQVDFPCAKTSDIDDYVAQAFGQTLHSVKFASQTTILAVAFITLLVTLLLIETLISKDRYPITVMRALGFTDPDIHSQYIWWAITVPMAGIPAGATLANTLGEQLADLAISSLGAAAFHLQVDPSSTYLLSPPVLLVAALVVAVWGAGRAGDVSIREFIKE